MARRKASKEGGPKRDGGQKQQRNHPTEGSAGSYKKGYKKKKKWKEPSQPALDLVHVHVVEICWLQMQPMLARDCWMDKIVVRCW
jgi:hypothetical protein